MKKILIFASNPAGVRHSHLAKDHTLASYHDVHIELDQSNKNLEVVFKAQSITAFDLVYFRTSDNNKPIAIPLALCLKQLGTRIIDTALLHSISSSKSYQYALFYKIGIPFPHTFIAYADRMIKIESLLKKKLTYPFVVKAVGARKGQNNYLIKNKAELFTTLNNHEPEALFVAQEFIPNDFDFRVLTTGYVATLAYKRIRAKDTDSHLNNVSQGGSREIVELASIPKLVSVAERASKAIKREVCGVDIVLDKDTGKFYMFEANAAPQIDFPPALKAVRDYLEELA